MSTAIRQTDLLPAWGSLPEGLPRGAVTGLVLDDPAGPLARCALFTDGTPSDPRGPVGCIGSFAAADGEAAVALLHAACAELARRGCAVALGPCDGSTWDRYRLCTFTDGSPFLAMEPTSPLTWADWWQAAGFAPDADYCSTVHDLPRPSHPRRETVQARLAAAGVRLRPLAAADLDALHAVSVTAFAQAWRAVPLDHAGFCARMRPLLPLLQTGLSLGAEDARGVVGFVFAAPAAALGGLPGEVVIKTLAILPDPALAGLGALLVEAAESAALARGLTRSMHALMHVRNISNKIGAGGQVRRRYRLYHRVLAS